MVAVILRLMQMERQVSIGTKWTRTLCLAGLLAPCLWVGTAGAQDTEAEYQPELLRVEKDVQDLKERVFRSKATLALLREIMIQGSSSGSRATVWHVNRLGGGYTIESISYRVDGQATFSKVEPGGGLDELDEVKIFDGPLTPGNHNIAVEMRLRGTGYGVFTYVQSYEFDVQNNADFPLEDGKSCSIRVVADERRWVVEEGSSSDSGRKRRHLSSFLERPNISIEEPRCTSLTRIQGEDSP
jgi:hypothetical protein